MITDGLKRSNGEDWSTGCGEFFINAETHTADGRTIALPSAVLVRLGSLDATLALFDTASAWSLIGSDLATALGPALDIVSEGPRMKTRYGKLDTKAAKLDVTFIAGQGRNLTIAATVLYAEDWPSVPVIGMSGLLEHVRFAVEPARAGDAGSRFYFASQAED